MFKYNKWNITLISLFGIYASTAVGAPLPPLAESTIMNDYDGIVGNAPKNATVSSTGIAFEETQNGAQSFLFFSQTLANQIYYEGRVLGRYNYMAQNPLFATVPVSNINNPLGYGFAGLVGYNFHASDKLDITPYLRMNYFKNMNIVYEDQNGNYINSTMIGGYGGIKFSFKVIKDFTPYINIWGGYQQIALLGNFASSSTPVANATATVDQITAFTEIGLAFKVSSHISLIPYWQYITAANYPDSVAMEPTSAGGFNISPLTNTQQALGFKFNASW